MAKSYRDALLQLALVAIVFAALPYKTFELDRYFVPKELVLHVVALLLAVVVLVRKRTATVDAADVLMVLFLLWSVASAAFATNLWLAQRAVSLSVASAIVFWAARQLGAEGAYRPVLIAASVAAVCAAATGLAQAYGLGSEYFSENRAPGGTFGNRNFAAHVCALGLPALVYVTLTARTSWGALVGTLSCGAVAAFLVLSRSRASWLAVAASAVAMLPVLLVSRKYWTGFHVGGRLVRLAVTAVVAAGAAAYLPNRLDWRSDSPYLDSALRVVDYTSGSGRGRMSQYMNSARMTADNPLLGVGPGNWPVRYVRFAPASDQSIAEDGMTANPWPSSDWVAFASERGVVAALALLGVFAALLLSAFRRWSDLTYRDAVLAKVTLVATIVATLVVSAFDAVLLLAAPALVVWSVIGAASGVGRAGREITFSRLSWTIGAGALILAQVVSVVRSSAQARAVTVAGMDASRAGWAAAAAWDPGSYRINLRAAETQARSGRCNVARAYARQARALFPYAAAPQRVLQSCR